MTKVNSADTHRRPVIYGLAASAALTLLVVAGSRNLEHYDPALFGYTVASVVAFGAVVYRYSVWLRRPATRVYWRRGWQLFRERRRLAENTRSAAASFAHNIVEQRFIARRGPVRWLMHALICGAASSRRSSPSRSSSAGFTSNWSARAATALTSSASPRACSTVGATSRGRRQVSFHRGS